MHDNDTNRFDEILEGLVNTRDAIDLLQARTGHQYSPMHIRTLCQRSTGQPGQLVGVKMPGSTQWWVTIDSISNFVPSRSGPRPLGKHKSRGRK